MKIMQFQGKYRWLSNFWPAVIRSNGESYSSVEHAYQAEKCADAEDRKMFSRAGLSAGQAKRLGRQIKIREDWDDNLKLLVMNILIRRKFLQNTDLREKLLATGDAVLVEGNLWGDRFWGVCLGRGENHLGKILMEVREELRHQNRP